MADWNFPILTDTYTNFLNFLKNRDIDLSRWFSTKFTAATNVVDGTVRWNDTNKNWEIYTAGTSSWGLLATKFGINVDQVDGADVGTTGNNILQLSGGLVPLGNIPATLTGKDADTLDTYHASTGTGAATVPVRDGSGNVPGNITGNAVTATTATTISGATGGSTTALAGYVPIRDGSGNVAGNITGNSATATKLQTARTINGTSFDGSANITITAAPSAHTHVGTDVTSAVANATNATNGRYAYNNGAYGGTVGYVEPSAVNVGYAASAGNAATVGGEAVTSLAQHRAEGRNFIDYARLVYDNGGGGGTAQWTEPSAVKAALAAVADNATNANNANNLGGRAPSTYACNGCSWACTSCTGSCSNCTGSCSGCTSCSGTCSSCTNNR